METLQLDKLNSRFRVAMLGATATGKTSMLASMYHQFPKVAASRKLTLVADAETSKRLTELLSLLQRAVVGAKGAHVEPGTIESNITSEQYFFRLEHNASNASFDLQFDDYPGGWLLTRVDAVEEIVRTSRVVLVAIDSPALMKYPDYLFTERHRPVEIGDILQRAIKSVKNNERLTPPEKEFLVLFVAMKCERWTPRDTIEIFTKFREVYEKAWRVLDGFGVPWGFLPIQTLGSVVFDEDEYDERMLNSNDPDGYERFLYKKRSNAGFAPADCDQVLRYVFGYLFNNLMERSDHKMSTAQQEIKNRTTIERIEYWFKDLFFGGDEARNTVAKSAQQSEILKREMEVFSKNKKTIDGFIFNNPKPIES